MNGFHPKRSLIVNTTASQDSDRRYRSGSNPKPKTCSIGTNTLNSPICLNATFDNEHKIYKEIKNWSKAKGKHNEYGQYMKSNMNNFKQTMAKAT